MGFEEVLSATTTLGPRRPEATCFLDGARAFELGGRVDPLYKTSSSCFRIWINFLGTYSQRDVLTYLIVGRHVHSILTTTRIP